MTVVYLHFSVVFKFTVCLSHHSQRLLTYNAAVPGHCEPCCTTHSRLRWLGHRLLSCPVLLDVSWVWSITSSDLFWSQG